MTDKEKIRAEIERLMYAYNQEADIASAEDSIGEKVAAGKYDVCKHLLSLIDSMQEEPVSEELEEAVDEYAPDFSNSIASKAAVDAVRDAFKAGAKWQKKKDLETIETAIHHAYYNGRSEMKEQMMEKAIDANCFGFQGAALFSFRLPSDNYLVGSKVKVIVIKED